MKKIPESFILDEADIKAAITNWLDEHELDKNSEFEISFKVEQKHRPNLHGLPGGMNDPIVTTVVTAVAVRKK